MNKNLNDKCKMGGLEYTLSSCGQYWEVNKEMEEFKK